MLRRVSCVALLLAGIACTHKQPGQDAAGEPVAPPPAKLTWKDVEVLTEAPKSCKELGEVSDETKRINPFRSNRGLQDKVLLSLKKQAAKRGGNRLFLTARDTTAINASSQGKVFFCDAPAPRP